MSASVDPAPVPPSDFAALPAPSAALDDLRARWAAGQSVLVEAYLQARPDWAADPEARLDLVFAEAMARAELGGRPTADEYAGRFPDLADGIRQRFPLFDLLGSPAPAVDTAVQVVPQSTPFADTRTPAPGSRPATDRAL